MKTDGMNLGKIIVEKGIVKKNDVVNFNGFSQTITEIGIPCTQCNGGCKTDVYFALMDNYGNITEVKLSGKLSNAMFIENKITNERASKIFTSHDLSKLIEKAKPIIEKREFAYRKQVGRIKAGSVTLGYRLDIGYNKQNELCIPYDFSFEQKMEIFAGISLEPEKKDCYINGKIIPNSGVANYMLIGDIENYSCAQDIFDNLIPMDKYCADVGELFVCFKANNYRIPERKIDYVKNYVVYFDYKNLKNKRPTLIHNEPFEKGSAEISMYTESLFYKNNINTFDDFEKHILK